MDKVNKRKIFILLISTFLLIYIMTMIYQIKKPLPEGLSYEGKIHNATEEDIRFLFDLTYKDGKEIKVDQQIFKQVFNAINEAEQFIVLDFFLYNGYYDKELNFPPLSETLTHKLIEKKRKNPNMPIVLITDEINTSYNSHKNEQFEKLKEAGIQIVFSDLDKLRDSIPLYSAFWRMFFKPFGQEGQGWLPNMMANQAPDMTLRSYLKLFNIKANHRKTVVTDKTALVLSGNPHDASAYHSNIAFELKGPIIRDLLASEQAVASYSNGPQLPSASSVEKPEGDHTVQLLTEGKVLKHVLQEINETKAGDELWLGMFYIAERKVIDAIYSASERGVNIKMILDPNENAFGNKKSGLPNRPVAREFNEKSSGKINIRWYNTTNEQYHPKLMYIRKQNQAVIIGGSTNFTARNLDDLNLETNVKISAPLNSSITRETNDYFNKLWNNENGDFTLGFDKYQDTLTPLQRIIYAIQKTTRFTTF